jgi:hypothetical protein
MLLVVDGYHTASIGDYSITIVDCDDSGETVGGWDVDELPATSGWDGTYTGIMEIEVEASFLWFSRRDTCIGTVEMVVDSSADPEITAAGTCSFSGDLAGDFPGIYGGDLTGMIYDDASAGGGVIVDMGSEVDDIEAEWSGSRSGDAVVVDFVSSFSFATTGLGSIPVDVTGHFEATRD